MLDYLALERVSHNSANFDIKGSLKNSEQLALIRTPMVKLDDGAYGLNTDCRFFTDDISYGIREVGGPGARRGDAVHRRNHTVGRIYQRRGILEK